jgi:hypothetical protein
MIIHSNEGRMTATLDFNVLERRAKELIESDRVRDAINVYIFMADGDPSLDGGYLGKKLGECYELLGEPIVAKYWYNRAVEENPEARTDCAEALKRLRTQTIDYLIPSEADISSNQR